MLARRGVGPKPRSRNSAKAWADLGPRDSGSLARVQWARKGPGAVWQASAARPAPIAAANRLSSARPSPTPVQKNSGPRSPRKRAHALQGKCKRLGLGGDPPGKGVDRRLRRRLDPTQKTKGDVEPIRPHRPQFRLEPDHLP